ncbi:L-piperidine-6-carboxylate dehydrogenase [Pseudonocardia sp. HH130630-07]|uniref:L-piperidine-6-carboxylate dehydrogenase n=1 Tax=Pseudonocardia sp. HH130630-07 TaxID=1690815 RepID=UPI000814C617|nr:aldehyde dehydrogenase family protein [Pseudonocardia sp. HH130630-07]ANY06019.1 aldehyde dehydrogenase [Pseudonocardia sp. HH130630-07]
MSSPTITTTDDLAARAAAALDACGVDAALRTTPGGGHAVRTPITGGAIATVDATRLPAPGPAVTHAAEVFATWRATPAPVRGRLVKRLGELLNTHRADLGALVTLEAGKIPSESDGEVQEMIDVCDLAVGLSRQLHGRTMASERPGHRLSETWQPLGPVAVITAFNFPVAVWAWNTALALVCGDPVVWKPSERTPLTALASCALLARAADDVGAPAGLVQVVLGGAETGRALVDDVRIPLVSATGSTAMGRLVAPRVAARFGRTILELGGNNAAVVTPSADLDLAVEAATFAAAGTAGQRCTTLRRLIVHEDVADAVVDGIAARFAQLPIGDPFAQGTLVGPLIDGTSEERVHDAIARSLADGGTLVSGGTRRLQDAAPDAHYLEPALVTMPAQTAVVREETFGPLLTVLRYRDLDEAIALHNDVPQGLSSGIFTRDQAEAERFLSAEGADCGIVNVNAGTSGAEIGGAFGGEKETGGGRECGSDAWKGYMRRMTSTVNYSGRVALAQDVEFGG